MLACHYLCDQYTKLTDRRLQDSPNHEQQLPDIQALNDRSADKPLEPPSKLPATVPASTQYRFSDTSIYPHLETNIAASAMQFSQELLPPVRSEWSIAQHGPDSPFRHWRIIKDYISALLNRNGYRDLVSYNTTVELVQKNEKENTWTLFLRKPLEGKESGSDYWWSETFDAVVVASGHYTVPYLPPIPGLIEYAKAHPGVVSHSKSFREPQSYSGKRVVVVGASISGPDIASSLASIVTPPLLSVVRGKYHPYFFDYAFQHPNIERKMGLSHFVPDFKGTVVFADGASVEAPDHIIFGTGYSWTLPFLPNVPVRNNRVPNLYQHIFWRDDPSLAFVGGTAAGFTFKVFEWQAVVCARYLAGRIKLPPKKDQEKWEEDRIAIKGDGVPFSILYPDFDLYFEELRIMAGEPVQGEDGKNIGRRLPKWEKQWREEFDAAHLKRIDMWKRNNAQAEAEIELKKAGESQRTKE